MNQLSNQNISLKLPILVALILFSGLVDAEEYLCNAKQNSSFDVAKLLTDCPVGQAVWNDSDLSENNEYWIQCGFYSKPLSMPRAKALYANVSQHVWFKAEQDGYRCLIGPYDDYKQLRFELNHLKSKTQYSDLFVRSVQ